MKRSIEPNIQDIRKVCIEAEYLFRSWEIPGKTLNDLVLSIEEALTNIIEHGYPESNSVRHPVFIEISYKASKVIIVIRDNGIKFNINNVAEPLTDGYIQSGQIGGFGVSIIRRLMDSVKSLHLDSYNLLWMTKTINPPTESQPEFISTATADAHVENGILVVRTHPGAVIDIEDAEEQIWKYFRLIQHRPEKTANSMLIDARGMTMITKEARKYYSDFPYSAIYAIAIIIDSIFTRWLANLFISMNKVAGKEIKMFNNETQARIWLEDVRNKNGFQDLPEIETISF